MSETLSIIIATRNRRSLLRQTLESLATQTRLPDEVLLVDASDSSDSRLMSESLEVPFPLVYISSEVRSAARQRNVGAERSRGSLLLFLDDDVIVEPPFIEQVMAVFEDDATGQIGGVSGTIVNQTFTDLSTFNRAFLSAVLGESDCDYAGRVVGPAVNFLPRDNGSKLQRVEWLPSTCVTYRRLAFMEEKFPEHYTGYSYAEDVHLSTRVGKRFTLLNSTEARLFHEDTGKVTHRDWAALGESIVVHRHEIMTTIMQRRSLAIYLRLVCYEGIYQALLGTRSFLHSGQLRHLQMQAGRIRGLLKVLRPGYVPGVMS